jgi:hypothetical protein
MGTIRESPRKLQKFLILFDNTSLLYFPGQFVTGRVLVELEDDTPVVGMYSIPFYRRAIICNNGLHKFDIEWHIYWLIIGDF